MTSTKRSSKRKTPRKKVTLSEPAVSVTHEADRFAHISHAFFKGVAIAIIAITLLLLVATGVVARMGYQYLHVVSESSGISIKNLLSIAKTGYRSSVKQENGRVTVLLLGIDTLANRSEDRMMTDTMMIASIDLKTALVTTFSIPRDLFITSKNMKINNVYDDARKKVGVRPLDATRDVVTQITGVPIQYVLPLELAQMGKLIDAIGGIDVTIDRTFTDTQFPRSDVDVSVEKDPAKLYETVTFTQGVEHMGGDRALIFVRSRHSSDPKEGSDDARALRQQKVIQALIAKLQNPKIAKDPNAVGQLLAIYNGDLAAYIPMTDAVALGKQLFQTQKFPKLVSHQFTVKGFDDAPLLYHPERYTHGQWVYLPIDPTYKQIQSRIQTWFTQK